MRSEARLAWVPEPHEIEVAERASVVYRNGPLYDSLVGTHYDDGSGRVSVPVARGTAMLGLHVQRLFGVETVYYTRRKAFDRGASVDLHVAGRAIDFMTGTDRHLACEIATYLLTNCEAFGIQFVVTWYNRWSSGQKPGRRFAAYSLPNKHTDHVHCELTVDASLCKLPWYRGALGG